MTRIVLFFTFLTTFSAIAQREKKGEPESALLIGLSYKASLPSGDLAKRWGFNNTLGLDANYKFANNLTVSLNGGFIFGNRLKDSTIFTNLLTSFGTITAQNGVPADVKFLMRGATGHASVGYVFNQLGHNVNSGLWVDFGVGYFMHKIRIESLFDDVPQLSGDYRKGYDKLSMGISTKQFIGYLFQANRRLFRFYAGVEMVQGLTRNVRPYNFDSGEPENTLQKDFNFGLKVGWVVPIKQRTSSGYYLD